MGRNLCPAVREMVIVAALVSASCSSAPVVAEARSTTAATLVTPTSHTSADEEVVDFDSEPIDIGPLKPRGGHVVVWTGTEMVVWGGERDDTGRARMADGAAYDPATDTWRMIADSPLTERAYPEAVWTGSEMVVAGGIGPLEAAAYDPTADTWRMLTPPPVAISPPFGGDSTGYVSSVWTGGEFVIWSSHSNAMLSYDPAADTWRSLDPPPFFDARQGVLRWDGSTLYALGAGRSDRLGPVALTLAELRDLDGGTWQIGPESDLSGPDHFVAAMPHLSAAVGGSIVAWSDSGSGGRTVVFDTGSGTWSDDIAPIPAHGCEVVPEPFVIDQRVFAPAWCGDASLYDPDLNTWSVVVLDGTGSRRDSVWTGREVLTWGDACCYGTGGKLTSVRAWRYVPPPR